MVTWVVGISLIWAIVMIRDIVGAENPTKIGGEGIGRE